MFKEKLRHFNNLRIQRLYDITEAYVFEETQPLEIACCNSGTEVVPPAKRFEGVFKKCVEGEHWGKEWENAWFHLTAEIPAHWRKCQLALQLDLSGETLLVDGRGVPYFGLCHGSVFDGRYTKTVCRLEPGWYSDGKLDLWAEAVASGLAGVNKKVGLPSGLENPPVSSFDAVVLKARIGIFNAEVAALRCDLQILFGLLKSLPDNDYRASRILQAICDADLVFNDNPANAVACREVLKRVLELPALASAMNVTAVGHAHIDIAWYWRMREAIRKSARTFASQIYNIEHYPDYVFGASQPHNYRSVKEHYPELYEKIREKVAAGSWELQGGMWVEADCNLISGESMVRQFVHGKNFFMDEFGVEVKNLWLPDVFGYSAAMPQIIRKSRCDHFVTQKISWSQFNKFPHHTFLWKGIDGTEVFTHFPPEDTYNADLSPEQLCHGQNNLSENGFLDGFLSLFGIGDGGGGPAEIHIERGLRMKSLEGAPKVRFGKAGEFLARAEAQYRDRLPVWDGELYLELHRSTLTTQAETKRGNRRCEQLLAAAEFMTSALPLETYPSAQFDFLWKKLLSNQFHDILPGSSIPEVYEDTRNDLREVEGGCREIMAAAATSLFRSDSESAVAVNSLSCNYSGALELPEAWGECGVTDTNGTELPCQLENGRTVVAVELAPLSFTTLKKSRKRVPLPVENSGELVLDNGLVRYAFAENGVLLDARDRETRRSILQDGQPGNVIALYTDRPANQYNEAWDVDLFTRDFEPETPRTTAAPVIWRGPVRDSIEFRLASGNSRIVQTVSLERKTKKLEFHTKVDWRESRKLLQTSFPVNIVSDHASYDIQYGFIRRPMHSNTSWDLAKFELPVHRYADVSDYEAGVALLNDCKYACTIRNSVIELSLLRAAKYPDYFADRGTHEFTYSLLPHRGCLEESGVIPESACLNRRPTVFGGVHAEALLPPVAGFETDGGVSLEVIKKAEKKNALVLRFVETRGRKSSGCVKFRFPVNLAETDLLEWEEYNIATSAAMLELNLSPFELKTFLIHFPNSGQGEK